MDNDGTQTTDWKALSKPQLLGRLIVVEQENARLKESVDRLLKKQGHTVSLRFNGREDDFVPLGWAERQGIDIPRADGYFESPKAWVRVIHGVITNAGIKNQSIMSVMIHRDLLDAGAETHGRVYADWRAAFFARVEAARYSDGGTGDPDAWGKEDRFSKLLKAVERKYLRYVDMMLTAYPKEKSLELVNVHPEAFIEAFGIMARAVNRINREADEWLKGMREPVSLSCDNENTTGL